MSESNILVSVIIPVYNTEKYIAECVESVLKQSYENIEVIIINDGSKDHSADVCRNYLIDSRVRFVDRENRGLSETRKQGISMVKGEYFCNLDSDDYLDQQFVEKMLEKAVNNHADIVTCARTDFSEKRENGVRLEMDDCVISVTKELVIQKSYYLHKGLWLSDSWNKLYRTAFVKNSGVEYQLNNRYNGTDLLFNHMLLLHCPVYAVLNLPLLRHRIVEGSRVHRKNKPLQEGFQLITDFIFGEAKRLDYPLEFYASYSYIYTDFLNIAYNALVSESKSVKELFERFGVYREQRKQFEAKCKYLSCVFPKRNISIGEKVLNFGIRSNTKIACILVYILLKIKHWK